MKFKLKLGYFIDKSLTRKKVKTTEKPIRRINLFVWSNFLCVNFNLSYR